MKKTSLFLVAATLLNIMNLSSAAVITHAESLSTKNPFSDVTESNPNFEAITSLKSSGVLQGYADGTYGFDHKMNRAEFAKALVASITSNPQGKNCFKDVHEEWYAPFVCEAKARGIVQGDGQDPEYYKPNDKITFSAAAKVVTNTYQLQKGTADKKIWYKEYVTALQKPKAIPLSISYFDEDVDRGEMAEMIWRIKEKVTDKASRNFDEISGEGLIRAENCADVQNRMVTPFSSNGSFGNVMVPLDAVQSTPAPMTGAVTEEKSAEQPPMGLTGGGTESTSDYSHTNVQVEGVDEADVIKNDDKYIYLIKGSSVRIVEAYPAETMKELVNFSFGDEKNTENFYPSEMYVDGNTLTVIGSVSHPYIYNTTQTDGAASSKMIAPGEYYPSYQNRTKVYIVDVTDHSKPKVQRFVEFDGNYTSSRKVGNTLYMVVHQSPFYGMPYFTMEKRAKDITANNFLPQMLDSKNGKDEAIAPCANIMILPKPETPNFLITAAVPLTDLTKEVKRSVIVGNAENIYASKDNLYVAATNWAGGYYQPEGNTNQTLIYKFGLTPDSIEYKEEGKVPGTILNQFSMDENNGYFRIATTTDTYSTKMNNNLYILDSKMAVAGKIEDIAPGERIYSVRFLGNRAYMVTFKTVDPLFVIDVADPKNPKILGKLKIPGYSNYLHPYDENHLMGFGNEVDESIDADKVHSEDAVYYTAVQGMKVGMFDVTDVNNPKEMFKEVIGTSGTTSELLYNHKALLFDKEKGLLAFPVTVNEIANENQCSANTYSSCPSSCVQICVPSSCTYENGLKTCTPDCNGANSCVKPSTLSMPVFSGAYVYNVNLTDGFKLAAKITHLTTAEEQDMKTKGYMSDYLKTIQRIVYMKDNLYTISQAAVKANLLATFAELKMITLAGDTSQVYFKGITPPMPAVAPAQ